MGVCCLKKAATGSSLQVRQPHKAWLCGLSVAIPNADLQRIFAFIFLKNDIESLVF